MKTAISLPEKLFKLAEKTASKLGIPRSQLFARALEEYIQHHRNEYITEKLNEIYSKESSNLDSSLKLAQKSAISHGDKIGSW
jgi:metal-responsive CopG/Arc/MetJ family transcriptional regulator